MSRVGFTGTLGTCSSTGLVDIFSGVGKIAFNAAGTKAYIPYANSNPTRNRVNVCDADSATGTLSNCVISPPTNFFEGPAGLAIY